MVGRLLSFWDGNSYQKLCQTSWVYPLLLFSLHVAHELCQGRLNGTDVATVYVAKKRCQITAGHQLISIGGAHPWLVEMPYMFSPVDNLDARERFDFFFVSEKNCTRQVFSYDLKPYLYYVYYM